MISKLNKPAIAAAILAVLAIIAVILIHSFENNGKEAKEERILQGSLVIDTSAEDTGDSKKNPLDGRSVELMGFDNMTLRRGQGIALSNSPENDDFFVKYEIENVETNEKVYETDLIPSGKSVEWVPSDVLPIGTYTLAFGQYPFWLNPETGEYKPLTGGRNMVEIEVIEAD